MAAEVYLEPPGIGISWLWQLSDDHWSYWAAVEHDLRYDLKRCGARPDETSDKADAEFLDDMLDLAGNDIEKVFVAEILHAIAHAVGKLRWPVTETSPELVSIHRKQAIQKIQMLKAAGRTHVGLPGESI